MSCQGKTKEEALQSEKQYEVEIELLHASEVVRSRSYLAIAASLLEKTIDFVYALTCLGSSNAMDRRHLVPSCLTETTTTLVLTHPDDILQVNDTFFFN